MVQRSFHIVRSSTIFWIHPGRESDGGDNKISTDNNSVHQSIIEVNDEKRNNSLIVPEILEKIGFCESGNQQFEKDGTVKRGRYNSNDIGKYQINLKYWGAEASSLGFDLFTEVGNTKMALYIFEHYGTRPWNWSKNCWNTYSN